MLYPNDAANGYTIAADQSDFTYDTLGNVRAALCKPGPRATALDHGVALAAPRRTTASNDGQ